MNGALSEKRIKKERQKSNEFSHKQWRLNSPSNTIVLEAPVVLSHFGIRNIRDIFKKAFLK